MAPGEKFTYRWRVIEGPSSSDPPCLSYLYYSAADPVRDTNSGLFGPIQVCKKGVLDGSGHQVMDLHRPKQTIWYKIGFKNEVFFCEKRLLDCQSKT